MPWPAGWLGSGLAAIIVGLTLFTIGFFAAHAGASGLVAQRAGGARAQASALYLCAYYLGSSVLGYAMGWVWQHWGWQPLIGCLATALLLAIVRSRQL